MRHFDAQACIPTYARTKAGPDQLVQSHMPLVRRIAWQLRPMLPAAVAMEDIIQVGMVALVEASRGYEDRGHAFSTYATMRIRGAMVDLLRKNANACRSALANRRLIMNAKRNLSQQLHREPHAHEVAEALGLDPKSYAEMAAHAEPVQLEAIDDSYSDNSIWFASLAEAADEMLDREKVNQILAKAIRSLEGREAMILQLYFTEDMNLDEIGLSMGIGAARVCQIKKRALEKLRATLTPLLSHDD